MCDRLTINGAESSLLQIEKQKKEGGVQGTKSRCPEP